jgi:gliding motility-associated-like protein
MLNSFNKLAQHHQKRRCITAKIKTPLHNCLINLRMRIFKLLFLICIGYCYQANAQTPCVSANTIVITTDEDNFCLGDSSQIIAFGCVSYTWAPTLNTTPISNNSVKIWPINTTTYTVIGTDAIGCTTSTTVTIAIQNPPTLQVTKTNDINCAQASTTLVANGTTSYSWQPAASVQPNIGNAVQANPTTTTTYTVTGTTGKCVVLDSITVYKIDATDNSIYIPTAITINNDGLNDGFGIKTNRVFTTFKLMIYNRYGQVVFTTTNSKQEWFANFNGQTANYLDTYYYRLIAEDACGKVDKVGDFAVVK